MEEITTDSTQDTTAETPQETEASKPRETVDPEDRPQFSQRDLNRLLAAERKKVREKVTTKVKETQSQHEFSSKETELLQRIADLEAKDAFSSATSDIDIAPAHRRALETLFKAERPEDPREWAQERAKELGFIRQAEAPPREPMPNVHASGSDNVTDHGSVAPTRGFGDSDDVRTWDRAAIDAALRKHNSVLEGRRYIRDRVRESSRRVDRVVPDRKR